MSEVVSSTNYYKVEEQARDPRECTCGNCVMWTVTYQENGESIEIGTAWQGAEGQEAADDVCDLMNMAYDAGTEATTVNAEERKLVEFFCSPEGDSIGRDGDYDNLTPAETAIRAIRELRSQLNNALNELTARAVNGN